MKLHALRVGHPPRIPVWLPWDQPVVYFVSLCVAGRHRVLANDQASAAFREAVDGAEKWRFIAAVLMPNHLHMLAAPQERFTPVGSLSAGVKRKMRRRLLAKWQWQPGCFDRLLRTDESAQDTWLYIREIPCEPA